MKEKRVLLIVLGVLLVLSVTATLTLAQGPTGTGQPRAPRTALGTGFTYQGQLKNGGSAVNGTCDFQFGLWDSAALGSQVGTTVTVPSVIVTNGLFTAPIDFGASAFNGDTRYLGIAVNCGSGLTPFASRQALTPAPYALYATNAGTATNFSGTLAGDVTGTQASTAVTKLQGRTVASTAPTNGQVLQFNGTQWMPATVSGGVSSVGATAPLASSGGATPNISLNGIVPIINGGTGSSTQNFVDLTTGQIIGGSKTFSSLINGSISGNASTATALAANGTNCPAGNAPLGVDAGGNAEGCFDVATQPELDTHINATSAHSATSTNTVNRIVMRDGGGNFAAGTITANLLGNATTANSATTATTATNFSGPLAGDVTGTQNSTTVSTVGGRSAANIAAAVDLALASTNTNVGNTIVRRDASGNFMAGTITANLLGNANTATTATNFSGALGGDVTGTQSSTTVTKLQGRTVSSAAPTNTQVLGYNGSQWTPTNSNTLPGTIAGIYSWAGFGNALAPGAPNPVFFGPTVQVTTNPTQRITGSGTAAMGLAAASNAGVDYGLCYQSSGGGALVWFPGAQYITVQMTTTRSPYTYDATVVPGAGTWNVGFCVRNNTAVWINNNDFVNGWVMVTN